MTELCKEGLNARGFCGGGTDEHAPDIEARPEELVDASDALGDEEILAFACFSASEVAGYGEQLHAGMCLAFFWAEIIKRKRWIL